MPGHTPTRFTSLQPCRFRDVAPSCSRSHSGRESPPLANSTNSRHHLAACPAWCCLSGRSSGALAIGFRRAVVQVVPGCGWQRDRPAWRVGRTSRKVGAPWWRIGRSQWPVSRPRWTDRPIRLSDRLICSADRLICLTDRLIRLTGRLICLADRLVCLTDRPIRLSHRLICLTGRPICLTGRSICLAHRLASLTDRPICLPDWLARVQAPWLGGSGPGGTYAPPAVTRFATSTVRSSCLPPRSNSLTVSTSVLASGRASALRLSCRRLRNRASP